MSDSAVEIFNYSKNSFFVKLLDPDFKSTLSKKLSPFQPDWINSEREKGWMISKKYEDDLFELLNYKQSRRSSRKPKQQEQKYSRVKKHSREEEFNNKQKPERRDSKREEDLEKSDHEASDSDNTKKGSDNGSGNEDSEHDHSDNDEESSEDELIQLTLGRKLKYESSQKIIEEDGIENSDLEDVISMCRRIRYLLNANKQLSERIRELEKQIKKD